MEQQNIANEIKKYLVQQFPATKNVGASDPLLDGGLIDSLGILDVVTFLENRFGVIFSDEDLSPENFATVRSIADFVARKFTA